MGDKLWDVFCATEQIFIRNVVSVNAPTQCPNNAVHAIRTVRLSTSVGNSTISDAPVSRSIDLLPQTFNAISAAEGLFRLHCVDGKLYLRAPSGESFLLSNDNDRQMSSSTVPAASASIRFSEIPDMTLTTNNISPRNYRVSFNATVGVKNGNNVQIDFIISIDDVDIVDSMRSITVSSVLAKCLVYFEYVTAPLDSNHTIAVKWRSFNTTRTKDIYERMVSIEGNASDSNYLRTITLN